MRPDRYTTFLHQAIVSAAADEPGIEKVSTFTEAGITDPSYGTVVTYATGSRVCWQTVFGSPDQQDDLSRPEQIVEGAPPPTPDTARPRIPTDGRLSITVLEAWLVHVLLSQGSREVRIAYPRSQPPEPSIYTAQSYGLHVEFHSGRTATTLPMYTLPPRTDPAPNRRHQVLEMI